jgi:hypothetical protein
VVKYRCVLAAVLFCGCAAAENPVASGTDITPRIGSIEIYGARKVSVQKIRSALGAGPGDFLPSREDAEERIDKVSGVVASRIEAACCEQNKPILYVGIEERDSPHVEFHPTPTGNVTLPPELTDKYQAFLDAVGESIRGKNADEDLTNGYSLMADPECREIQQSFIPLVANNLAAVDRVLRESSDPEQRGAAAYLLQYGPRGPRTSKIVVNGLQWALRDVDDNVRENAVRALKAVAVGAKLHPEQQIRIEPTWFVELMNSVVWSDRRNASLALVNLTEQRDPETVSLLRERALPSIIEMARWHDLEHALPAFILAGRLAGLDEKTIQDAWISGNREPVLKKALKANGKHLALTHAGP